MAGRGRPRKTTAQTDRERETKAKGFHDPNVAAKEGTLNPNDWDGTPCEVVPYASQTERIRAALKGFLDEFHGYNGQYAWEVGLFLEDEIHNRASSGWQLLTEEKLGELWTLDQRKRIGLINHEGCLAWPGRGTYELHLCMVMRSDRYRQMVLATEAAGESTVQNPDTTEMRGVEAEWENVKESDVAVPRTVEQARIAQAQT